MKLCKIGWGKDYKEYIPIIEFLVYFILLRLIPRFTFSILAGGIYLYMYAPVLQLDSHEYTLIIPLGGMEGLNPSSSKLPYWYYDINNPKPSRVEDFVCSNEFKDWSSLNRLKYRAVQNSYESWNAEGFLRTIHLDIDRLNKDPNNLYLKQARQAGEYLYYHNNIVETRWKLREQCRPQWITAGYVTSSSDKLVDLINRANHTGLAMGMDPEKIIRLVQKPKKTIEHEE